MSDPTTTASEAAPSPRRRPSSRAVLIVYLAVLHVGFAAGAVYLLRGRPIWLLVTELTFLVTFVLGAWLVRAFFLPLELVGVGADMLEEEDFTVRFRTVAPPELNRLLEVYNRMAERLHQERVRVEEQNELLDRVIDASPGGVLVCDFDGRIEEVNPAAERLLGTGTATLHGLRPESLAGLDQIASLDVGEAVVLPFDSGRRLRVGRTSFRDRGFERDLFWLEELTDELRRTEKEAYSKVIRLISHEVNNSIGPVSSLVQTVGFYADRLDEGDRQRFEAGLDLAAKRLDHLRAFVEGFADVVKLPAPSPAPCRIDPVVADVVQLMTPTLADRGVHLTLHLDQPLGLAQVDKNQFEQVLVNVIKNGAEAALLQNPGTPQNMSGATPQNMSGTAPTPGTRATPDTATTPTVTVATEHRDGRRWLTVTDNGPGLSDDAATRLFQPFFTTKEQGRGLGLTLVQEILRGHGLPFSLETGPEGGAVFRIGLGIEGSTQHP